ncbi:hypothetical protein PGT21_030077 [Puccinia graminis f. sp. tritici]|uniref:Uncharacterized protein n=3 Tax=Puccinia graminis f. sp. tritici TaxID=56615 RepID=E3K749_PUCGT|nr:uncharacterized protein PGTG_05204 [Puccinia graminis f. sp. tritici CRL 75-36-700-3]EFP79979.2 hypothetical protein PGTG_05204 [Puccinia graminis f. sp. tritici CRL 75-36-700-3]KAA1110705.1 hypothetical protein PGT21_030077 [Puccinia graminis f. sp. tritici]
MPNITFQHNERLILTANPISHEKAVEDARVLFCLEQAADIIFYLDIAEVGRAELAPSSWRSLRCGSLISVVAKSQEVATIPPQHDVGSASPVISSTQRTLIPKIPLTRLPLTRSVENRRSQISKKVALKKVPEEADKLTPPTQTTSNPTLPPIRLATNRQSQISNKVAFTRGPKPVPKIRCPKCFRKSVQPCDCLEVKTAESPVLAEPVKALVNDKSSTIGRPPLGRFYSENAPKPACLRYYDDHGEPWDCPRFCDFVAEVDQKQELPNSQEEDPEATAPNTIIVQLEQAGRGKTHRPLPPAMLLGVDQRFQVVFGKISSWTSEPPERIGLTLIRDSKPINISPLSCPSHLEMVKGDKLRVRICPPVTYPQTFPRKALSSDGINWVRSFRDPEPSERLPRRNLSHLSLPANPRPQKGNNSLSIL